MSSDVAELERVVHDQPTNWTLTTLGGALEKSEGGGTPPRDVEEYWNGDIPWASVKDIVKGEGFVPEEKITPAGLANSTSKLIPAGTNIFAARMGVGAVVRYPFPVALNFLPASSRYNSIPQYAFEVLEGSRLRVSGVPLSPRVRELSGIRMLAKLTAARWIDGERIEYVAANHASDDVRSYANRLIALIGDARTLISDEIAREIETGSLFSNYLHSSELSKASRQSRSSQSV